ncbi:MAG: tryptophan synthase subunit beta, partial [Oscillospiraceae bacterium]|nr:tryptophan synthase subunit beta [Oscillospiraceae bacterium]
MAVGRFGDYGGRFIPETLMTEVIRLEEAYESAKGEPDFLAELEGLLR